MSYNPSKKNLEHSQCLGMLSTDPLSPCSVINNRSFGKLELVVEVTDKKSFKTEVRKLCRQQIQKKVQMDKINLFPPLKMFLKRRRLKLFEL